MQTLGRDIGVDLRALGRRRARTGRVFERIALAIPHLPHQLHRILKIGVRFFRETDDEIARHQNIGTRLTDAFDQTQIALGGVAAVHPFQDAVAARLNRQMQIRHQFRHLAMCGDQIVVHIVGVRGGIADTL